MRNNKNSLDEMQTEQRNRIGNQMFMLMSYALLINSGLYSFGIRWLDYPANVMVIIMVCMGIYLVKLIALNAYLPPKAQSRKTVITLILTIALSVAFAVAAINFFGQSPSGSAGSTGVANDNSALILLIVSVASLLVALITALIKKANNKGDKEE